jgi:serine/threonine-protein phosphatase 5
LFNGDIVDRGAYSVECLLILMALKVAEPDFVFVSLGNHETMTVGKLQFFKESVKKYGNDEFFRLAHILFKSFPVSFLLEDEIFITHGGLSPFLRLERIRMINRMNPSREDADIINDLTWSDPVQQYGIFESQRGLGYLFGPDITKDFLKFNNISAIIRSHQYKETGYSDQHDGLCITVFSCPNYR